MVVGRIYIAFLLLAGIACRHPAAKKNSNSNSTPLVTSNARTELTFDSTSLENTIREEHYPDSFSRRFKKFYSDRNYQYAWFTPGGLAEQAINFWNAQSNYIEYTRDSSLYNSALQELFDTASSGAKIDTSQMLSTELALSVQFFRYARLAYQGKVRLGDHDLDWYIPRKRIEVAALLDSLIKNRGRNLEAYEPVNHQYQMLKQKLLSYYQISKSSTWQPVSLAGEKFKIGDSSHLIGLIKKKLYAIEDLALPDTSSLYDTSLTNALKHFQSRYGLKADGKPGAETMRYLNEPIEARIRQILVNMERMRWIPVEPAGDFILVNIPQFRLVTYEDGKRKFAMNIVAGNSQNQTVIFTGDLKFVVFSPYWNVPPSIIKKEILPGIKKDPKYLAKHNMEWNNGAVRQKPGRNNSLGKVKFLFPNNYNIYLHDTPAKSLFNEEKRAFSHGCIRLADPKRLASWVLRKQPEWTTEKINRAMNAGKEKFVTVKSPIPVFLGYFTAWVDEQGNLNFRDDLYGHDQKLADRIFAQ